MGRAGPPGPCVRLSQACSKRAPAGSGGFASGRSAGPPWASESTAPSTGVEPSPLPPPPPPPPPPCPARVLPAGPSPPARARRSAPRVSGRRWGRRGRGNAGGMGAMVRGGPRQRRGRYPDRPRARPGPARPGPARPLASPRPGHGRPRASPRADSPRRAVRDACCVGCGEDGLGWGGRDGMGVGGGGCGEGAVQAAQAHRQARARRPRRRRAR